MPNQPPSFLLSGGNFAPQPPQPAPQAPQTPQHPADPSPSHALDELTRHDLAATIYAESGGKNWKDIEDQSRKIYDSILLRAKETNQGPRDVVSSGQYHGYGSKLYKEYVDGPKNIINQRKAGLVKRIVDELSVNPTIQDPVNNSFHHEGFGGPLTMERMEPIAKNPKPTSTPYPFF